MNEVSIDSHSMMMLEEHIRCGIAEGLSSLAFLENGKRYRLTWGDGTCIVGTVTSHDGPWIRLTPDLAGVIEGWYNSSNIDVIQPLLAPDPL